MEDRKRAILAQAPAYTSDHVFDDLARDLQAGRLHDMQDSRPVLLVADDHTYPVCGEEVEEKIRQAGLRVTKVILSGQPCVAADEGSIVRVMKELSGQDLLLVAVGSGTITDIVRFVAYQARLPFISIPTAPSVDAYTSYTAAITIGNGKLSIPAKPPVRVYAHLPTLRAAPRRMIASGFGDMVAKYTALADWKLAHLIAGDDYNESVDRQAERALRLCAAQASAVKTADPAGIAALMDSLLVSGRCMVAVKSSRPAAGAEHSLAHFWEIRHHLNGLPESLHGEKTGSAAVIIARLYEQLRQITSQEAARRLEQFCAPEPEQEYARVRMAYRDVAEQIIANRPSFLGGLSEKLSWVIERLIAHWDEVQAIAATVPSTEQLISLLESAGAPWQPEHIHVTEDEVHLAIPYAMYVRDRFTILELNRMLKLS